MAGTVIDSLVVELGLDPAKFTKGQRDALDTFKKTQGEFDRRLKDLEVSGKRAGESFASITTAAEGLLGVLAGAGMAQFTRDTMNSAAATGRLAQNMGLAVDQVDTFGRMMERNGGNADAAKASLKGFTDQVAQLATFGKGANNFAEMSIAGITPGMSALQAYMQFAKYAGENRNNPQRVGILGQSLGLDQAAINEALKGIDQVRKDWEAAKVGALTDEQQAAMRRMQEAWVSLDQAISMVGRDLVVDVEPAFTAIAKSVSGWTEGNRALAESLGGILAALAGLTALKPAGWLLRLLGLGGIISPTGAALAGSAAAAGAVTSTFMPAERAKSWNETYPILGKIDSFFGLGGASTAKPPAGAPAAGGGSGAFGSQADKEAYIRQMAAQIGIDPDVAMRVAKSEGFNTFKSSIPGEQSFGAFQLHVTPGGRGHAVGDEFTKDTGLDPSDPANERQGIDYALNWVRKHGWGDFHGAGNTGIGKWQGIGSTTDVQIGSITINTRATDAAGIARDLHSEIKGRLNSPSSLATQANTGMTP